jgi:hypothetical protein
MGPTADSSATKTFRHVPNDILSDAVPTRHYFLALDGGAYKRKAPVFLVGRSAKNAKGPPQRRSSRLLGCGDCRLRAHLDAETEMAEVAGFASVGADEKQPVEDELDPASSSRSEDRRVSTVGAMGNLGIENGELHISGLVRAERYSSAKIPTCRADI